MHHPAREGRQQATNIHETSMPTMTSCPLLNRLVVIDTTDLYVCVCVCVCVLLLSLLHGIKMSRWEAWRSPFVNTRSRVRLVERSLSFELFESCIGMDDIVDSLGVVVFRERVFFRPSFSSQFNRREGLRLGNVDSRKLREI